jgi:hypothetical protein
MSTPGNTQPSDGFCVSLVNTYGTMSADTVVNTPVRISEAPAGTVKNVDERFMTERIMTAEQTFKEFLFFFKKTKLWEDMENTHEDSPWHREASVAVHTQMLLDYYNANFFAERTDKQRLLSMVGCLMHDVGKPMAEIKKFSEERGEYRAYHGHELMSARIWTDYAMMRMQYGADVLGFSLMDIANVALMVEHHVPFALKDKRKRKNLKDAFIHRMGNDGHQAWLDLLNSDQHGRISDDQPKKLADVAIWMEEWELV